MIVTFYSYKGGVGRSMALANVAEWFRLQGLKVVMVDWDLEAPGLESFFSAADSEERKAIVGQVGVIDLIDSYRDMFPNLPAQPSGGQGHGSEKSPGINDFAKVLQESLPPLRHFLRPVKGPGSALKPGGSLHLLPAGCRTDDRFDGYAEAVQSFDWADLYANFRGEEYFEWMRSQLDDPAVADIVLIDSRTGVSEMSGMCTRQLADVVVILCAPNDQNLEGVAMMARSFTRDEVLKARGGRPVQLLIVPARVDVSEGHAIDRFEMQFQERLDVHLPAVFRRLGTDYRHLRVPYISAYAYSERLAVGDAEGAKSLQEVYGRLATHIAVMAPMRSELRQKSAESMLALFGPDALAAIDDSQVALNNQQRVRFDQLKKAFDQGVIDQDTFDAAVAAISGQFSPRVAFASAAGATTYQATLTGSGAIAQGAGTTAVGVGGVFIRGQNTGSINTGNQLLQSAGGAIVEGAVQVGNGHFIGRDFIQIVNQAVDDPEEAKSVIALYLHALAADLAGLKLGEIDTSADRTRQSPLQLADIYVPLDTTLWIPDGMALAQWLESDRSQARGDMDAKRKSRPVPALEALAVHPELTVLGKPGSGKSTFGASVLLALAQAWQGHADELANLGEYGRQTVLLPIRVVLRRFAEQLPPGDAPARAGDLWAFIGRDLDASGYGLSSETIKHVRRLARNHGALMLFDGLDECGDSVRRDRVLAGVRELMRSAGQKCRFLLTARPYAWPGGADPARGVYALADLAGAQIEQFIRAWYAALVRRKWRSPGEAARKMDDLLQACQRPDLMPMAQSPLLLTLMATLHTNRGRLPDDRADLYSESVDLLMLRWNRQIGADNALLEALGLPSLKLSDLREVLENLAFEVHAASVGEDGAADIGEDRLVRAFRPLLNNSQDKAAVVVEYIEKRAGLLVGQGEKGGERQFTFPHRTFQEFLAACHLAARQDFAAECTRLARAAPTQWQVVLPLAARLAKAERGASAADELIGGASISDFRGRQSPDATDWACAHLAGMQLLEIGLGAVNSSSRAQAIAQRVTGWLVASLPVHPDEGGAPASQRAQAGDVLAALGDPRFNPEHFNLPVDDILAFIHVQSNPQFMIGTRETDAKRVAKIVGGKVSDNEINDTVTPTSDFYIARYPVTVAQFGAFVAARQLEDETFRIGNADALKDPATRPVRFVSWHEAVAYCKWLNDVLAGGPGNNEITRLLRGGQWQVALPSELEWEKAARGKLARKVYPWGDTADPERANYTDAGIGDTSAVGCFPANDFGLHDMIGNVWEWTRSTYQKYPYDANDTEREDLRAGNDVPRVVRGGSWDSRRFNARCAIRGRNVPDLRLNLVGFRVVLRSALASKP